MIRFHSRFRARLCSNPKRRKEKLGIQALEWVAGGSAPGPPKFFKAWLGGRCEDRRNGGLKRKALAGLLGGIDAPSIRVSLAGLLFSSAPFRFPERGRG